MTTNRRSINTGRRQPVRTVAALVLGTVLCAIGGSAQISTDPNLGNPGGWYGDEATPIAVLRPGSWTWYISASANGACPHGFAFQFNIDHMPLCTAQFGLPGDQALPGYYSQTHYQELGVFRPGDGKIYFLPQTGKCPQGSTSVGRLASGFLYCSQPSIIKPGTEPLFWPGLYYRTGGNNGAGYWDPHTLTFAFPLHADGNCPDGFAPSGGVCKLIGWGNNSIVPMMLKDGYYSVYLGFFDPASRWEYMLYARGAQCPRGWQPAGGQNSATVCAKPWTGAGTPVGVRDIDSDVTADLIGYDQAAGKWTASASGGQCPIVGWTKAGRDAYGYTSCTAQLGGASSLGIVGDYDGDGRGDIAVWDTQTGIWTIVPSSGLCPAFTRTLREADGTIQCQRQFGAAGDQLVK